MYVCARVCHHYFQNQLLPALLVSTCQEVTLMPSFSFRCCGGGFVLICLYYFSVCCDKGLEGRIFERKGLS